MATFGQIQTYISARLLDPSNTAVSVSTVNSAINDAIRYWKFRRFWFNQGFSTQTLTTQSPIIPLPDDFLVEVPEDGFVISYSNLRWPLTKSLPRQFDDVYLDNGYGRPTIYTRKQGNYTCYFIPDRDYTLFVYYLKLYDDLVNESDTNDFTDNAERLIELWTLANLHAELRQDDKMEAYYRAAAMDEFNNLELFTAKANPSGRLVIDSYL
jgi:hypothetical protein